MQALYMECGCCGHFHHIEYGGDCRDNTNRFSADYLDAKHGESGWTYVDEQTQEECHVRHDMLGFYVCSEEEAEYEDKGHCSAGFDGRAHYSSIEHAWRSLTP